MKYSTNDALDTLGLLHDVASNNRLTHSLATHRLQQQTAVTSLTLSANHNSAQSVAGL